MEGKEQIFLKQIQLLNQLIEQSNNIVFFGGAGVSTESGIPDYRSKNGLYNNQHNKDSDLKLEDILTNSFFKENSNEFYKFYKENFNVLEVKPNIVHYKLAELERKGKISAIITQNIDRLHQKAGSKNVIELHGNIEDNYCMDCNKKFSAEYIFNSKDIPTCDECGGIIHPGAVLYDEPVKGLIQAKDKIQKADLLIVAGTSLSVKPASTLLDYYNGEELIVINKENPMIYSTLYIDDSVGKVFRNISIKDKDDFER